MHFTSPIWLLLLVPVVAMLAIYLVLQLRRKKYVARFSNVALLATVAPRRPGWRRHLTFALLFIGLTFLTVGAAQPNGTVRVPRDRATVMLAIDVSISMEATDVLPTRIAAAQSAAKQFIDLLPAQINVGLVEFSRGATVLVTPTLDRDQLKIGVDNLTLSNYTAIGDGIYASLQTIQAFAQTTTAKGDQPPPARIVLMSDGESNYGRTNASAIQAAQAAKTPVSTIAFGTPDGTITVDGQTANVAPNLGDLQQIAQQTGGSFHTATSADDLKSVFSDIGSQVGYTVTKKIIAFRFFAIGLLFAMAASAASLLWGGRFV